MRYGRGKKGERVTILAGSQEELCDRSVKVFKSIYLEGGGCSR